MQRKHYCRLLHNCKLKSLILKGVSRSFIKTWNSFAPPCCKYEVNPKRNVILISNHYILCSNDILSLRVYFIKKSKPVSWCCTFRTMKIKKSFMYWKAEASNIIHKHAKLEKAVFLLTNIIFLDRQAIWKVILPLPINYLYFSEPSPRIFCYLFVFFTGWCYETSNIYKEEVKVCNQCNNQERNIEICIGN